MAPPQRLPTRKLGKHGPDVAAIGFGTMVLSAFYGKTEADEERFKVLDRAWELGETNWDSADVYLDSEDLIGKWFKRTGKRDDIFLATKFANKWKDDKRYVDSSPEYCKKACATSLRRLGIDTIDLYYAHRVDGKTPIEKTVRAMVELKNEGKIRYLGLSEVSSDTLRRACKVHHIDAVQIEYSPFCLDIEDPQIGLLATCRELGVAVIAYSPLGRGLLTGALKSPADLEAGDWRTRAPRFSPENFPRNLVLAERLAVMAQRKGCSAGQLTLAWLLQQGTDIIPIPGTKKMAYLEENVAALGVRLSEQEDREVREEVGRCEVVGTRYPEGAQMALCFGDTPPL